MKQAPLPTQRWVSETEPALGLGVILEVTPRQVEILFSAAGVRRQYALASAPLRRVEFRPGDVIRDQEGEEMVVEEVVEDDGLLSYRSGDRVISEAELSDTISFSAPEERLMAGSLDHIDTFDLRLEALGAAGTIAGSSVRGFVGPRIDLIPHQLSIAGEVASRLSPRVLLADEVGLGKTIEAGLILHHLHLRGRADRLLILVPEPLIHQWFVELYRRFNLPFTIVDSSYCEAFEESEPEANPFLSKQLVLCGLDLLSDDPARSSQAIDAGWDLLVVDEAHHLEWTPDESSPEYRVVELLASRTPGLLLLTGTPEQFGPAGHFARLRLLDPDRYASLEDFVQEVDQYGRVVDIIERIESSSELTPDDLDWIDSHSAVIGEHARALGKKDQVGGRALIEELLDSFGTGRVMFRNTRRAVPGFPERSVRIVPLEGENGLDLKIAWLVQMLQDVGDDKILLICGSSERASEIHERLRLETGIAAAIFHEGMSLVTRDRSAAGFAADDGARILISSEIGSEGRNFQFAGHLVLFDLPSDPELLEQRIGRLDRIGRNTAVNIHVPYHVGTRSEVLARWYDEGLNAFEKNPHGASEVMRGVVSELNRLIGKFDRKGLEQLIKKTRKEHSNVSQRLERGYDRLLQINSNRPGRSQEMIEGIRSVESDRPFEAFFVRLLEHFGVTVEEIAPRTYVLRAGHLLTDSFPAIPSEGMGITFDRRRGLVREDLKFFTPDHPFVRDVIGLLLEGELGNSSVALWEGPEDEKLLLEMVVVLETVAPASLGLDRYLPPRPIRVVVDHRLNDRTDDLLVTESSLRNGEEFWKAIAEHRWRSRLPVMIESATDHVRKRMSEVVDQASEEMWVQTQHEIDRLTRLEGINPNVDAQEIDRLIERRLELAREIREARLRVEGLRIVVNDAE